MEKRLDFAQVVRTAEGKGLILVVLTVYTTDILLDKKLVMMTDNSLV